MADKKIDPFDVEALEKSVNDSATRVSAIWVSYLIFGLYLVIAAGTVTHRQLFLQDPVKLPVLNIDLPMVGFFLLAPFLFVIFHAYLLIQVLLLGRTAAAYNEAVEESIKVAADNARVRQRLANTLFAQIFAGSPRERDGWLGQLLRAMAWSTLAIAPVLILLVFQFQSLPYHSQPVTWTLRVLIVIDLALVLVLWPALRDPGRDITLRDDLLDEKLGQIGRWVRRRVEGFYSDACHVYPVERVFDMTAFDLIAFGHVPGALAGIVAHRERVTGACDDEDGDPADQSRIDLRRGRRQARQPGQALAGQPCAALGGAVWPSRE